MKVDFSGMVKDLDGSDAIENEKTISLGKVLGRALVSVAVGDPLKYFDWATKMYNDKPIDIDRADQKTLIEFIEKAEGITILTKAQLILCIDPLYSKKQKEAAK